MQPNDVTFEMNSHDPPDAAAAAWADHLQIPLPLHACGPALAEEPWPLLPLLGFWQIDLYCVSSLAWSVAYAWSLSAAGRWGSCGVNMPTALPVSLDQTMTLPGAAICERAVLPYSSARTKEREAGGARGGAVEDWGEMRKGHEGSRERRQFVVQEQECVDSQ